MRWCSPIASGCGLPRRRFDVDGPAMALHRAVEPATGIRRGGVVRVRVDELVRAGAGTDTQGDGGPSTAQVPRT